jgi:hypothetical protein
LFSRFEAESGNARSRSFSTLATSGPQPLRVNERCVVGRRSKGRVIVVPEDGWPETGLAGESEQPTQSAYVSDEWRSAQQSATPVAVRAVAVPPAEDLALDFLVEDPFDEFGAAMGEVPLPPAPVVTPAPVIAPTLNVGRASAVTPKPAGVAPKTGRAADVNGGARAAAGPAALRDWDLQAPRVVDGSTAAERAVDSATPRRRRSPWPAAAVLAGGVAVACVVAMLPAPESPTRAVAGATWPVSVRASVDRASESQLRAARVAERRREARQRRVRVERARARARARAVATTKRGRQAPPVAARSAAPSAPVRAVAPVRVSVPVRSAAPVSRGSGASTAAQEFRP